MKRGMVEKGGGGGEGRAGMCVLLNYQMVYCIEQHMWKVFKKRERK